MKRNYADIADDCEQRPQEPGVERRMRVTLHVDEVTLKHVLHMHRVSRLDLGVLRAVQIVKVVTLNRLVEKQRAHQQDHRQREQ